MKNIFILFVIHTIFCHGLLSQDTLFVGDLFIKGEFVNSKSIERTVKEYKIDLDCSLSKRLANLICNCDVHINKNRMNGFTIRSVSKDNKQLIIISPNTSQINIESSHFDGVFFLNEIPFFVYKAVDMNTFLSPTRKEIVLKYYKNSNEMNELILSNLVDERFVSKEVLSCKKAKFNLVIEKCTETKSEKNYE